MSAADEIRAVLNGGIGALHAYVGQGSVRVKHESRFAEPAASGREKLIHVNFRFKLWPIVQPHIRGSNAGLSIILPGRPRAGREGSRISRRNRRRGDQNRRGVARRALDGAVESCPEGALLGTGRALETSTVPVWGRRSDLVAPWNGFEPLRHCSSRRPDRRT